MNRGRAAEEAARVHKFTTSVIGDGDEIRIPRAIYRARRLGGRARCVIGRAAAAVSPTTRSRYVRGYTVANDVSARDLQFADGQWVRGEEPGHVLPARPELVSVDDPQNLKLITRVNGEVMQDSNTIEMIFGVAELISFCSQNFALEPGDMILTGTPWGCGEFMEPKRSLKAGDVVECEIPGIGVLRNPVVEVS